MVAVPCDVRFSIALAVYTRSPAAYEALRDFKLLQLPSVRTLKYYIDANLESAGDSMERLKQSRKQYVAFTEEKRKESMDKATTSAGLLECMYPQSQSVGRHSDFIRLCIWSKAWDCNKRVYVQAYMCAVYALVGRAWASLRCT